MRRSRYRHTEYLGLPITIRWSEVVTLPLESVPHSRVTN